VATRRRTAGRLGCGHRQLNRPQAHRYPQLGLDTRIAMPERYRRPRAASNANRCEPARSSCRRSARRTAAIRKTTSTWSWRSPPVPGVIVSRDADLLAPHPWRRVRVADAGGEELEEAQGRALACRGDTADRSARAAAGSPHNQCSRPVHPSRCPSDNRRSALNPWRRQDHLWWAAAFDTMAQLTERCRRQPL
jgi:hypothetical protein